MEKRINNKDIDHGFTLIELLTIILILSLIISLVIPIVKTVSNNVSSKIDKASRKIIYDATNEYVLEYRNSDGWKEYVSNDGSVNFCVSLNSLVDSGYYNHNDDYIIKNKDKIVVKGVMNTNKVYDYDLVNISDVDKSCGYVFNNSELNIYEGKENIMDDDGEDDIGSLEYKITSVGNNVYDVDINFLAELGIENVEVDAPVYVAIVLDNSNSMRDESGKNVAENAAISLSETIVNELDNSHVALIQYNDNPMLARNFEHEVLTSDMFINPSGGTNVSGGLDLTATLFDELDIPKYSLLYTILLYDGMPNSSSYLINNNNNVFNGYMNSDNVEVNEIYYDNFLAAYYGNNNNYQLGQISSSIVYIKAAAKYLKSNFRFSKLITIGYNYSGSNDLKTISTQDNEFCEDSDYFIITEKNDEEDLLGEEIYTTKQLTYPFVYNEDNGSISSSNKGFRTESYGYYLLDLSEYSIEEQIEVEFDYKVSLLDGSPVTGFTYDYFSIIINDDIYRDMSKFSKGLCDQNEDGEWVNNNDKFYFYCGATSNKTKIIIPGGKKYYMHFYYEQNAAENKMVTVNSVTYSISSTDLIYDSFENGYNYGDIVSLSTEDESRLVYDSIFLDGKLGLSGQSLNSYSGTYKKIDLTEMEGKYILTVNARNNYGMGAIYLSSDTVAPYPPAIQNQVVGVDNFNYGNYSIDGCNKPDFRCVFNNTSDMDFNFLVEGGKIYYLHFINSADKIFYNESNLIINSVILNKVLDDKISINMENISSDSCSDGSLDYVSCLKKTDDNQYSFVYDNGSIISSNKEVSNTCSHSYTELDLTSFSNQVVVNFNSTISSQVNKDYGNIIITDSASVPVLNNGVCNLNGDNRCVLFTSGSTSNDSYVKLDGGEKYYVHFMYCKDENKDYGGDYFKINKINIESVNSAFGDNGLLNLDDTIDYKNYTFKEVNKSLVSTNKGIGSSVSHSYMKIDLSSYDSSDRFLFQVDDFASHDDRGIVIMTNSSVMPSYYDRPIDDIVVSLNNGNDKDITTNEVVVNGGKVYYLHFVYGKNKVNDSYEDIYKIDSVRIYKFKNSDIQNVSLSTNLYSLKNYQFELKDGKYVSTNDLVYTSNYSYFMLDLSNYSNNDKFSLKFNATLEKNGGITSVIVNQSENIPEFYSSVTIDFDYNGTKDYSTTLYGGYKYYVHILNDNFDSVNKLSINEVSLNKVYVDNVDYYCYYDSNEEKIGNVFSNLSTRVIDSVPKLTATNAKIILTTKTSDDVLFHIEDNDGNIVDTIEKDIELSQEGYTVFELKDSYKFILDNVRSCDLDICSINSKLFDISLELEYKDGGTEVIKLDDELIPVVNINYYNDQVVN